MLWWTMDVVETFNREYARGCESFNFIFVPIRVKDKLNAKKLLIEKSTITFSDVNFSYHGNKKIFNNLSIEKLHQVKKLDWLVTLEQEKPRL
jgi:ABC-type transport system involved in Fe-S cluster assembly fused permease/ATPase subunit